MRGTIQSEEERGTFAIEKGEGRGAKKGEKRENKGKRFKEGGGVVFLKCSSVKGNGYETLSVWT